MLLFFSMCTLSTLPQSSFPFVTSLFSCIQVLGVDIGLSLFVVVFALIGLSPKYLVLLLDTSLSSMSLHCGCVEWLCTLRTWMMKRSRCCRCLDSVVQTSLAVTTIKTVSCATCQVILKTQQCLSLVCHSHDWLMFFWRFSTSRLELTSNVLCFVHKHSTLCFKKTGTLFISVITLTVVDRS